MESRKYQLQTQIIEALAANDNELYSLLKSQWAHRFGVESLEELKNLDFNQFSQSSIKQDNQKGDQSKENPFESDQPISTNDDKKKEKEIKIEEFESINYEYDESFQSKSSKSYEIVDKKNNESKSIKPVIYNDIKQEIDALIPLPPKPKYGYLRKWLLRN